MATAISAAMNTGLPQSTRMSNVPATATNGALLPATTTRQLLLQQLLLLVPYYLLLQVVSLVMMLLPRPFLQWHPGLLQGPQQYPVYFLPHPVYVPHSSCRLTDFHSCPSTTSPP
jgi:hypothetical protein